GSSHVSEVRSDGAVAASPPAPVATPAQVAAAPSSGGGTGDVAAALESLAGLRDKGLITPEEYEAKKRELLERL
ncbi:MAG TPA: SHOCT domain-containing protein, partial [Candidatus Limnocylindria bacterium]|nr:SHOCT domain-containing protein [Candidatus Limnocylindria bacterium]